MWRLVKPFFRNPFLLHSKNGQSKARVSGLGTVLYSFGIERVCRTPVEELEELAARIHLVTVGECFVCVVVSQLN